MVHSINIMYVAIIVIIAQVVGNWFQYTPASRSLSKDTRRSFENNLQT